MYITAALSPAPTALPFVVAGRSVGWSAGWLLVRWLERQRDGDGESCVLDLCVWMCVCVQLGVHSCLKQCTGSAFVKQRALTSNNVAADTDDHSQCETRTVLVHVLDGTCRAA